MDSKVPWGKGYVSSQEGNIYTGWWSVSNRFYFHPWGRFIFQMGWNHQLLRMQCFGWSTWERRRPNGEPWAVEICGKKHVPFNTPLDLYRFLFHTYIKFNISMGSMCLSLLWSSLPWDQSLTFNDACQKIRTLDMAINDAIAILILLMRPPSDIGGVRSHGVVRFSFSPWISIISQLTSWCSSNSDSG